MAERSIPSAVPNTDRILTVGHASAETVTVRIASRAREGSGMSIELDRDLVKALFALVRGKDEYAKAAEAMRAAERARYKARKEAAA